MKIKIKKVKKKRCGEQPIIHRLWKAEAAFRWMRAEGIKRKKFSKPKDLTIVTAHNYPEKSLFEHSLDFLGVKGYHVLHWDGVWRNSLKITLVLDFLRSGKCDTDYLLFCDAKDCIMWDDPHKLVEIFERFNCKMVFNSTLSSIGLHRYWPGEVWDYSLGVKLWNWANMIGPWKRYLNAGVYIGKPSFIEEVLDLSSRYISNTIFHEQGLFRAVRPIFHPHMQIDAANELVYRN